MATDAKIVITAVDRTKGALNSVEANMRRVGQAATVIVGAVAATTAALGTLAARSLKTGDELGKTADKLGVTTEALAGLRLAAERTAGVTSQTLDTALQRLVRRTSEAAQGTGEAKDAIKELGLDAAQLSRLAPDEQFRQIADAMQGVANQGDRVRLAMRLFDTEGVALVNTLDEGSAGLDAFADQAERLGLALNRVDVAKLEAANDAMADTAAAAQGIGNQIAIALAPALTVVSERMTALASDSNFWGEATTNAINGILTGMQTMVDGVGYVIFAWENFKRIIGETFGFLFSAIETAWGYTARLAEALNIGFAAEGAQAVSDAFESLRLSTQSSVTQIEERMLEHVEFQQAAKDALVTVQNEIAEASTAATETQVENLATVEKAQLRHRATMAKSAKTLADLEKKRNQERVQSATQYTNAAISLANALFGENKAVAIGSIVANTAAGIAKTWAQLGWPAAIPGVAAIAASGAAQLSAARGASKGGGSVSSGGGGGFSQPSPVLLETGQSQQAEPTRNVAISLTGGLYSAEDVRGLIRSINDEIGDGVTLGAA